MAGGLLELDEDQLRRLAKLIRNQELQRTQDVQFGSENERAKYIKDCRDNYKKIMELLDKWGAMKAANTEEPKSEIAHKIYDGMKCLVNHSLQAIRNYTVRKEFLNKVVAHSEASLAQLEALDPKHESNARRLAKDADAFKEAFKTFNDKHRSNISKVFAEGIKEQGLSFEQLVARHQNKRGLSGPFKELTQEEKFLVYEDIINESGRGKIIKKGFSLARAELAVSTSLITFTAALMVWDIFSSPWSGMLEKATRNAVDLAAGIGGAMLGDIVTAAILEAEIAALEGAAMMVTVAGFIGGAAVGFLLSFSAGLLMDSIFTSGGQVPSTKNFKVYIADLPDGEALARQIAHHS